MNKDRYPIYELSDKINFLAQRVIGREKISPFAEHIDVPRKTLQDGIRDECLSSEVQRKLASKCGFSLNWPEWNDPDVIRQTPHEERRDKAKAFQDRYNTETRKFKSNKDREKQPNVHLKRVRENEPKSVYDLLASLQMFAHQCGPGEPSPISFELACLEAPVDNMILQIRCGELRLNCNEATTTSLRERIQKELSFKTTTNTVHLTPGGTNHSPFWILEAEEGGIGVLSLPHDFCMVHNLSCGDVITANFKIYVKDLEPVEEGQVVKENDQVENIGQTHSLIMHRFSNLSIAKQKVLKRLAGMQIPGGENGWLVICQDELSFMAFSDREISNG